MLQFIKDLPVHVLGIHAIGDVTEDDFERTLIPLLTEKVDIYGEIYYLLILETNVDRFTFGAWWRDMVVGLKYFTKWKKIAIVTDQKAVRRFTNVFNYFIVGKSKSYPLNKIDEAVRWVSEKKV